MHFPTHRSTAASIAALVAGAAGPLLLGAPAGAAAHDPIPPAPKASSPTSSPFASVAGKASNGKIFVTPTKGESGYPNSAQILDRHGRTVWSHTAAPGTTDADFRAQTLHGKPVLTFWEGTGLGGLAQGTNYIYNRHHKLIRTVSPGPGLSADGHEFLLEDNGTAWVLAYQKSTADLTSIGGSNHQTVINGVVQKVNVKTGKVLFSWNSADHVPYSQSYQPLPASPDTPWDWFHVNAVHRDADGKVLVDARNTWTAYKVAPKSGRIVWQLGGKASSFAISPKAGQALNKAGQPFAWQHDINNVGENRYTVFDNESAGTANTGQNADTELDHSRAVTLALNPKKKQARLVRSLNQPDGQVAPSQGNAQTLEGGQTFVGWGSLPAVSEFDRRGRLIFDARFPAGVNTYRAYLLPWRTAKG